MDVSVLVNCFNEDKNIGDCLISLMNQRYNAGRYEVIVVDGGSKDNTQQTVREFARTNADVTLVIEAKKGTAAGRNTGIRAARYDYVAFIDADCEAPPDWLAKLVENYKRIKKQDSMVIAVGGTNIPPADGSRFLRAISVALDAYVGSFSSVQGRQFREPVYVSSLSNLNVLYNKQKIIDIGYYDESLVSEAEDAEINFRLHSAGYKLLFVPDSFVWHKMRPNSKAWLINMFRYGKGRARLLKRYPQMWSISYVLPVLFITFMFSISFVPFSKVFYLATLYFPGLFCFSLFHCLRKKSPDLVFRVMFVYLIQHFGYAAGEMYGLLNPNVK